MMAELTHFDAAGAAHMVDVSEKPHTDRVATAGAWIKMTQQTFDIISKGTAKKGGCSGRCETCGDHGRKTHT